MNLIDENLLKKFRGPGVCEYCRKLVRAREAAHIVGKGMGRARRLDHPWNLIALCAVFSGGDDCHFQHHQGHRPMTADLIAMVAQREGVLQGDIIAEMNRLRRL